MVWGQTVVTQLQATHSSVTSLQLPDCPTMWHTNLRKDKSRVEASILISKQPASCGLRPRAEAVLLSTQQPATAAPVQLLPQIRALHIHSNYSNNTRPPLWSPLPGLHSRFELHLRSPSPPLRLFFASSLIPCGATQRFVKSKWRSQGHWGGCCSRSISTAVWRCSSGSCPSSWLPEPLVLAPRAAFARRTSDSDEKGWRFAVADYQEAAVQAMDR